ncbi:type ISP restriction/modification enzyme [Nostoc sp.]|uniref:type ISP restriction/modification enzyme n=1 Tax=Nostoc sp. TaxID=1180 RepID=UPI002FF96FA9
MKGNARTSGERRRRESGNIFSDAIRVGIAVYFLVRNENAQGCKVYYNAIQDYANADEKKAYLGSNNFRCLQFEHLIPDKENNWINLADTDFDNLIKLVDKDTKLAQSQADNQAIFKLYTNGVNTARDEWVFDENNKLLEEKIIFFINKYNYLIESVEIVTKSNINNLLDYSTKWSDSLKSRFINKIKLKYNEKLIIQLSYRPYIKRYYYSEKGLSDRLTSNHYEIFGNNLNNFNKIITLPGTASSKEFSVLASKYLADFHFNGDSQCFPLYRYEKDGNRIDNITDWVLAQFQTHYGDSTITKLDIFHYTYAVLHNPAYRTKYELNLKREFPRLPFYDDFHQWVNWGKQLMDLHINYETVKPYPLKRIDLPLATNRTPKAKLKADTANGTITLDDVTTLEGVPKIAWEYRLGNRSALEWILDQYKEKKSKDPTIAEKFNTYRFADYKEQVIDLLERVCTVSVETMQIIQQIEL